MHKRSIETDQGCNSIDHFLRSLANDPSLAHKDVAKRVAQAHGLSLGDLLAMGLPRRKGDITDTNMDLTTDSGFYRRY